MLFELPNNTECTLTSFTGRTQKSGPHDVPAVTIRLKLKNVPNLIMDRLSKTMRLTVYAPVEEQGQERLPDVEYTTPILRSKDLKEWEPETSLEGWSVIVARGITDDSALQMGACKVDKFHLTFYEGGHVDVEFNVGTADLDEAGAGMLWALQKQKVFVMITAPEVPKGAVIDGSKDGGGPGFGDQPDGDGPLFDGDDDPVKAAFLAGTGSDAGGPPDSDTDAGGSDGEGSDTDVSPEARREAGRSPEVDGGTRTARGKDRTKRALAAGAA